MSKKIRNIIISAALVLVLGLIVFIISILPKPSDNTGSGSGNIASSEISLDSGISIFSYKSDEVRRVDVKNAHGSYTISYVKDGEWKMLGYDEYPKNEDYYSTFIDACCQLSADKLIAESPEDMSVYGLSEPQATVTLNYSTSETLDIDIGSVSSSGGTYIYVKQNDKVYVVNSTWADYFTAKNTLFIDMTMVEGAELDEDGNQIDPKVQKISYTGRGVKYPIVIERNPYYDADYDRVMNSSNDGTLEQTVMYSPFMFTAPFEIDTSEDKFDPYAYMELYAKDIEALKQTPALLNKYGLSNPYVTIDYVLLKKSYKINLGNYFEEDGEGYYYATVSGKSPIYIVEAVNVEFFKEDLIDYISPIVVNVLIDDIKTLTVKNKGVEYKFELSGTGDDLVCRWDGKKMSTAEFRDLYQLIMLVYSEESVEPNYYNGDAEFTLTYTYRNSQKVDTVEYVKADVRKYLIRLNGKDLALVRSKYVDTLAYGLTEFINGRDVPSDY